MTTGFKKAPLCNTKGCVNKTKSLCSRCLQVYYCSAEHQKQDYSQHKRLCLLVKKSSDELEAEEARLRSMPPDMFLPEDVFESGVGHFWGIHETRDYMRARFRLVEVLEEMGTPTSLQTALDHALDCLRLCRGDNMGVREHVPGIMLRLHKDQECYDFIKWWATCDPDGRYDWGDTSLPYLNLVGENALENADFFLSKYPTLSHLVALALIKFRMLQTIREMEATVNAPLPVPNEVKEIIVNQVKSNLMVPDIREINARGGAKKLISDLENQFKSILAHIEKSNVHLLKAFANPKPWFSRSPPAFISRGGEEEAHCALMLSYAAYETTPESLEAIKAYLKG